MCVLVSGGVESAALLASYLERGERVHPLFVRCGFWWEEAELAACRRLLRALRGPRLERLAVADARAFSAVPPGHWALTGRRPPGARAAYDSVYLPGRNLTLLSCAAALCARRGLGRAALGCLKGNPFRDASPAFFRAVAAAIRASYGRPFVVETPLRALSKRQVVARWPDAPYALTLSCLHPLRGKPCARCSKCEERRRGFS